MKTTFLAWTAQRSDVFTEEQRMVQGHRKSQKSSSLRRYSRDDVYPQLQLQATLTSIVQAGWRPALAQHRGAQAPMVEPDEEKLPHLVPKQKFVKAPSPCNFRVILVAVRKCLWVGQPTSSMQFALIHLLSREHQLSKELRGDQCVGLG